MAVTAVVQQVSAVGCHESVADLPAIPLVTNTMSLASTLTVNAVYLSWNPAKPWLGEGGRGT